MKSALISELKSSIKGQDLCSEYAEDAVKRRVQSIYFGGGTPSLALVELFFFLELAFEQMVLFFVEEELINGLSS